MILTKLIDIDDGDIYSKDLFEALKFPSTTTYERWCKQNIEKNKSVEIGEDYFQTDINGVYSLSVDFSKRLALMSDTKIADDFRGYFIEVEKEFMKQVKEMQGVSDALKLVARLNASHEEASELVNFYKHNFG